MKKIGSYLLLAVVLIFTIIFAYILLNTKQKNNSEDQIAILFYGDGCPHCVEVEKYIAENNIKEKIIFIEKEVYKNANNAKILNKKAKKCGIKENEIGVPFLWAEGKCYMGNEDIINFFNNKTNES